MTRRAARGTAVHAPVPEAVAARVPGIDALRGLAIVAMVAYHFCFDLAYAGVAGWNFYRDPFWLHARTAILSSFLLLAGVSLVLADRAGMPSRHFWRHVGRIAACALLVTSVTLVMFPRSFIWFGVLHAMAVSLVLARPLVRMPWAALGVGVTMIVAGNVFAASAFDTPSLGWIGFATRRPATEDYVPLFPWMGVLLVGIAAGHALAARDFRPVHGLARAPRGLRFLGRHSLATYVLHQPLLMAIAFGIAQLPVSR